MDTRGEEAGKRGEWKGGREEGRSGVEGLESEVRASERRWVVSTSVNTAGSADGPGVLTDPPRCGHSFFVIAGFTSSRGELTSCMRSSPPRRFGSRNSSPS